MCYFPHPMNKLTLSETQITHFKEEGYTLLGRVMDDAELEAFRREEARFRKARARHQAIEEGQTAFFSLLAAYSQVVRDFITGGRHLDPVEQLMGPNVATMFNQFVTKMPDGGKQKSEFPWHQDNGYVAIEPADNITVWIALDDVDEQNGCVWVMPQSHLKGLLPHKTKSADSWHMTLDVEGDGEPAILKAGEAVAFTGLTLHRSKYNLTDKPRRGFFSEYCLPQAHYVAEVNGEEKRLPVTQREDVWVVRGEAPMPDDF